MCFEHDIITIYDDMLNEIDFPIFRLGKSHWEYPFDSYFDVIDSFKIRRRNIKNDR